MADPTQVTGTPALNPPALNEPQWTAVTPQVLDNYDVVIGNGSTTVGLLLYRNEDAAEPDKTFKNEAVDWQYAGTFVDRANVGAGYGDDQQAFWMTFTQKDWSGGVGQKYFRNADPQNRSCWGGLGVDMTSRPGGVTVGANPYDGTPFVSGPTFRQCLYYKNGAGLAGSQSGIMHVTGDSATTIGLGGTYDSIVIGGTPSGGTKPHDLADAIVGDNGQVYVLESIDATTATLSTIHHVLGPQVGVNPVWDHTTKISGSNFANCMVYWPGGPSGSVNAIYVGTVKGQLVQPTLGSNSTGTLIKDFGGGTIISMLATPKGIYILYGSTTGEYRLYLYDGTTVSQAATLPRGWRYNYCLESQNQNDGATSQPQTCHVMAYQDGVLYINGLMPCVDALQAHGGAFPNRTTLWYYASGNTGIVWQADTAQFHHDTVGGPGPVVAAEGCIMFCDLMNGQLMSYNPATQGVSPMSTITTTGLTTFGASGTTFAAVVPYASVGGKSHVQFTTTGPGTALVGIGSTIRDTTVAAAPDMVIDGYLGSNQWTAVIGSSGTSMTGAIAAGDAFSVAGNFPIICQMAYDPDNAEMQYSFSCVPYHLPVPASASGSLHGFYLRDSGFRVGSARTGVVISSLMDFDSSMDKYFRDVQWDGVTTQGFPAPFTETAGTVDLYYMLNDVPQSVLTGLAGLTLIQAGATPGTRYNINQTGKSICIVAVLNVPASSGGSVSAGPVLRKISVRAAPITPTYRHRTYQIAMFDNMPLKNGGIEPRTPAQLRADLEVLIAAAAPPTVSDAGVTGMLCMFDTDNTKIREMRPNEYVAYLSLREI